MDFCTGSHPVPGTTRLIVDRKLLETAQCTTATTQAACAAVMSHACEWTGGQCRSLYEQCRTGAYRVESSYLPDFVTYRDLWMPSGSAMTSTGVAIDFDRDLFQDANAMCSLVTDCDTCQYKFSAATATSNSVCNLKTIPNSDEYEVRKNKSSGQHM